MTPEEKDHGTLLLRNQQQAAALESNPPNTSVTSLCRIDHGGSQRFFEYELPLERSENRLNRGKRWPVTPHPLTMHPLGLLRRLLALPLASMSLDRAKDGLLPALIEVPDDQFRVLVVVERQLRGGIEPAPLPL